MDANEVMYFIYEIIAMIAGLLGIGVATLLPFIIIAGIYAMLIPIIAYGIFLDWKLFVKMGEPGWKALIPYYRQYIKCEKVFGNGLWFLLIFSSILPGVGYFATLFFAVMINLRTATTFRRETWLVVLSAIVPVVGVSIIAFDKNAVYYPEEAKMF